MVGGGDPFYLKLWVNRPPYSGVNCMSMDTEVFCRLNIILLATKHIVVFQ